MLAWLRQHPGWLLILDNADTEHAATAIEALIPHLFGGHLLVTRRLANWSHCLQVLPVGTLSPLAAVEFLLAHTQTMRRTLRDDPAQDGILADTLGNLALALGQAGAYICQRCLNFDGYLQQWCRYRHQQPRGTAARN